MTSSSQRRETVEEAYRRRYDAVLVRMAATIGGHIADCMRGQPRIDRITARAKDVGRFVKKAATRVNGELKYVEPLNQIQDQIGARIVVFYKADIERISEQVKRYFRAIEYRRPSSATWT